MNALQLLALGAMTVLAGMALLVRARLGVMPWDVLHQGLARTVGGSLGTVSIVVGALVLLLWIPLQQRPGVGTVSNVVVIGLAVDASLAIAADNMHPPRPCCGPGRGTGRCRGGRAGPPRRPPSSPA